MDNTRRAHLQNQREVIVRDLDVRYVLDELYSENAIDLDEKDVIMSERTKRDRARCLLDILAAHPNASYDSFVNVLRKDYMWLANLLEIGNISTVHGEPLTGNQNNSYYDALTLGDLPRLPPNYIPREVELELLQSLLYKSERSHYILLHGMPGSGKSCLCTAALNDPNLLSKAFKNRVYWINVAEIRTSVDILTHLNRLYKKLSMELNELEKRPHSMTYPPFDDIEMLKYEVRRILLSSHFYDCLVVLDDVASPAVFRAFDFGSKCLVTTRDQHIASGYCNTITYISLTRGFTPIESLTLFSKCTGIQVSNLPQDAQTIHKLCKGAPIVIALIGSILQSSQDRDDDKNDCWKYCVDKLTNKEFSLKNYRKSEQEKLFNAIRMCIDSLSLELRVYYKSLAIFVEDLNIMPSVLQVMWKLKKYPVEEIMTELKNKSLVVSKYNKDLRSNVYGIHDLLLTYLKSQISKSEKLQMHSDLIMNYYEISGENFAKLPNDNYIYSYIAYHLTEAQLWSKFACIYYDLDFIAAKIRAVGSMDLLSDYSRFKKYICQDSIECENRLEELKDFVRIHGHNICKYINTDVVQYALQQAPSSFLHQQALEMIKDRPSSLYFNFQHQKENVYYTHTLDLQEEVCSACFTNDTNHILVGTSFGQINLWEQEYKRILCTFRGHEQKITYMELSPDASSFLSVSEDGSVKLWPLEETLCTNSTGTVFDEHGFTENAPSPRFKQENWHNFFESNHWIDVSQTFMSVDSDDSILSASYSYDNNSIVTGTQRGLINVWNIETHEVTLTIKPVLGEAVKCVIFSLDDSLIISSMGKQVSLYDSKSGEFLSSFCTNAEPSRLLVIPFADNSLVVINKQEIAVWSWERDYCEKGVLIKEPSVRIMDQVNEAQYLCGAITCDGQFVVSGSSDSTIRMWNIETGHVVKELRNNDERVICLDTFWNEDESAMHILLSGSDDQTVKQWHVEPVELKVNRRPIKLLPIFSTYWPPGSSLPYLAVVDNENRLRVMCGHNLISETEFRKEKIQSIAFARCGTKIALGLENGRVEQFDYQARKLVPLMDLHAPVQYLEYLEETTISENGCHIISHQKTKSNDELSSSSSLMMAPAAPASSATTTLLSKRRNGSLKINLIKNQCLAASSCLNSSFMIHRNQKSQLLSKPKTQLITTSEDQSSIDDVHQNPIVKCFMLKTIMKMLSISRNRTLKMWDLDSGRFSVLEGSPNPTVFVQSVALAADESMISLSLSNCEFQIFKLTIPTTFQNLENVQSALYQSKKLQTSIHSCDFSSDVSVLALGLENGQILLWSILNNCECRYLKLHRSPVRYLSFSSFNDPLVLVSVSEQIVWWNIKNADLVPKNTARVKRRSLTSSLVRKENGTAAKSDAFWKAKCANDKSVLSAIKLRGPYASQLSVNSEFNSFFTIDVNGNVYFLNVLK